MLTALQLQVALLHEGFKVRSCRASWRRGGASATCAVGRPVATLQLTKQEQGMSGTRRLRVRAWTIALLRSLVGGGREGGGG
jgi:hypothetical protein